MPATSQKLTIDPQGLSVVVGITDWLDEAVTAYTADGGDTAHELPKAISAATDFFIADKGRYTISAKLRGVEVAGEVVELNHGVPVTYVVNPMTVARFGSLLTRGITTQTDAYTLALADAETTLLVDKAEGVTVTIPLDETVAFPSGTRIRIIQIGAGQVTVAIAEGGTLSKAGATAKAADQFSVLELTKIAADTWVLSGDVAAE